MYLLITGLALFLGVHSIGIFAQGWRNSMHARIGELSWKAVYSIASIAGFVLIIQGFSAARAAPVILWAPPTWARHVALLLMLPVFPLFFSAYLPGRIRAALKHPMLAAVKLWAFAHLLANGSLADVVLFGSFLVWAVLDRISLKRRPPQDLKALPAGRANDAIAVVLGLFIYAVTLLWLHQRWIGVSPLG